MKFSVASSLFVGLAVASPLQPRQADSHSSGAPAANEWADYEAPSSFPIHESCNASQTIALEKGLSDVIKLATHAKAHLLRYGNSSEKVQMYFGEGNTATPIGWYERVLGADRGEMLFRCDDPDQNCATQDGWAGHWRGANATMETVICPLSFQKRQPLELLCLNNYTVADSPLNTYWGTDLMHRIFHVPQISEGVVEHYAEDFAGVMELAETNSTYSGIDSDTLQYFAVDVYAYDIAAPGVGCTGEIPEHDHEAAEPSAAETTTAAAAATTTAANVLPPSPTASVGCVPHEDHWHCEGPAATSSA